MINKGGRPTKEIDYNMFVNLCKIQCTEAEVCSVLEVTDKTLNLRLKDKYGQGFSEVFKKFAEHGKASLRRFQFKSAEGGNATMQIWLGKQYLNQKDRQDITSDDKRIEAVKVEIVNGTKS